MSVTISGPFTGHGPIAAPVVIPPRGGPAVRETRMTITDDQATRLRAMVAALEGRPSTAPRAQPPPPAPAPPVPAPPASPAPAPRPQRTARVVTIASGKGGVGKTSTSVNLAIALTQLGKRITVLDADLGMANADVLCGLTPTRRLEQYVGVSDAPAPVGQPSRLTAGGTPAPHKASLSELALDAPGGFRLIPGSVGIARMTELSSQERDRLISGLSELDQTSDLIIVDTGAGLGREVISFSRAADLSIIIATPEPTSIADAYALIKCILTTGAPKARSLRPSQPGGEIVPRIALVVNQVAGKREAEGVHARMAAVCHRFLAYPLPLLGWVVQDARVALSVRKRRPLLVESPGSPAAADLRALAERVAQELRIGANSVSGVRSGGLSGLLSRVLRGG